MQTEKFIRKVRPVEAMLVTEDNLSAVAGWCQGLVVPINGLGGDNTEPYVHVTVRNPRRDSDSQAFVGMWVIREDYRNYRVVSNKQLKNSYDKYPPVKEKPAAGPSPKSMPQKQTHDPSGQTEPTPSPTQVGAVQVTPGTPPDEGSPLTTGTVRRSAVTGEFVTEAEAAAHPDTTVAETIERESNVQENSFNHDALASDETRDEAAPETDGDMVQLGVPDVALGVPELCGECGSEVVDGLCSNDPEHNVFGTAEEPAAEQTGTEG